MKKLSALIMICFISAGCVVSDTPATPCNEDEISFYANPWISRGKDSYIDLDKIHLINNFEELTEFKKATNYSNRDNCEYYDKFDESFFSESSIIVLFYPFHSSSFLSRVDSVIKSHEKIYADITTINESPGSQNLDSVLNGVLIEVDKADIAGIKQFDYRIAMF
jgi:hypothetical protein